MIPFAVLDSPDPEAAPGGDRANATWPPSPGLIGDTTPDRRYASTVTALMTGFGETVRTLDLFAGWDFDELVARYGAIVQAQIDACRTAAPYPPDAPHPTQSVHAGSGP